MDLTKVTREGVVVPIRPDPSGGLGPTPDQVRGPRWRRTGRGLYVPRDVTPDRLDQRIVEAAANGPESASVTGWAALAWARARWFDGLASDGRTPLPVPLSIGDRRAIKPRVGLLLCEDWLFPDDAIVVDGLAITTAVRATTFEVRRARSLERAVRTIDMAAAADLVSLAELSSYATRLRGRPGTVRLRDAIKLAHENAWSPLETRLRLEWRRPGGQHIPNTLHCNMPIFDLHGHHLFTPDLFDPEWAVAGEYDGAVHDGDDPRRRDLDREELYRTHHIQVVTMMRTDARDLGPFHHRLRAAYGRAASGPRSATWTLTPPPWWVDTSTVEKRRALDPATRARWLARQEITDVGTPRRT